MAKKASVSEVRAWAKEQGFQLGDRGRLPLEVWDAWNAARKQAAPLPKQRVSQPEPAAATAQDLQDAQARIGRLEQQVAELTERLTQLENRPVETRRRFARAR